jgi:mono/diheme cytochrome c family protein
LIWINSDRSPPLYTKFEAVGATPATTPPGLSKGQEVGMRSMVLGAFISALAVVASSGAGHPQGVDVGKNEYVKSCAICHGTTGKGDGSIAHLLKRNPADLTKLSGSNFGVFPFARVYDVIDGRFEIEIHGRRNMPVWGEAFQPAPGAAELKLFPNDVSKELAESIVRARILALIDYIFSLQAK